MFYRSVGFFLTPHDYYPPVLFSLRSSPTCLCMKVYELLLQSPILTKLFYTLDFKIHPNYDFMRSF